jgi:hypothetical protein
MAMDEFGSTGRESSSRTPPDDGGLREIVERATGSSGEPRESHPRRYGPSRLLRALIGLALFGGGLGSFGYGIVHLIHIGTCGSGPTPYVIAHACPSGTGSYIGLVVGGLFVALIGGVLAGVGTGFPGGVGFAAIGAAVLYGGVTAPSSSQGAEVTGYTVGVAFIVVGLLYLAYSIWSRRWSPSAAGVSRLIAATEPKPQLRNTLSGNEGQQENRG